MLYKMRLFRIFGKGHTNLRLQEDFPHEDRTHQREQSGRKERHHRGRSEEGRGADGPRGGQLRYVCR